MFQERVTPKEFIEKVNEAARVSSKTKVTIDRLPDYIADKRREPSDLRFETISIRIENERLLREHNVTKDQLQAFMIMLPFLKKLLLLSQVLSWMDIEKMVVNKDRPATNVASLRSSNANFDRMVAIDELIKNLNEGRRSEQKIGLTGTRS